MYNICMEIIIGWRIFVQIFLKYKYGFIVFDWLFVLGNLYSIKMAPYTFIGIWFQKNIEKMLGQFLYGDTIAYAYLHTKNIQAWFQHDIPFWLGIWTCPDSKSSSENPVVPLRVVPFSIANCTISMKYKNPQNQQIRVQIQLVH